MTEAAKEKPVVKYNKQILVSADALASVQEYCESQDMSAGEAASYLLTVGFNRRAALDLYNRHQKKNGKKSGKRNGKRKNGKH